MSEEYEAMARERQLLIDKFGALFSKVESILFKHDPIGIAYIGHPLVVDNPDEYAPEVETILPRLHEAQSESDLTAIIHEEFTNWFGSETAGDKEAYRLIAIDVWDAWQKHKKD